MYYNGNFSGWSKTDDKVFNIYYLYVMMFFKTALFHVPSFMAIKVFENLAVESNFNKRAYKILLIILILSVLIIFFGSMFVELKNML